MGARLHWRTGIVAHHRSPPPGDPSLPFPRCGPPRPDARGPSPAWSWRGRGHRDPRRLQWRRRWRRRWDGRRIGRQPRGLRAARCSSTAVPTRSRRRTSRIPTSSEPTSIGRSTRYVTALTKLRKVAPASLHEPIDELRRDVSRHDFADGAPARGAAGRVRDEGVRRAADAPERRSTPERLRSDGRFDHGVRNSGNRRGQEIPRLPSVGADKSRECGDQNWRGHARRGC